MKLYEFIFLILAIVSLIDYIITTIIIHQCKDLCNLFRIKNRSANKKRTRNTYNSNYNSNFFIQICILRRNKTMTDEEKKAIEVIKGLAVYYDDYSLLDEEEIEENEEVNTSINIVINLIEKQSKEIEELQELSISVKAVNQIDKLQKEIEELKEKNRQSKMRIVQLENEITARIEDVNKYYTPNDKIKAKIEEIDIEIQCCEYADDDTEEYKQDIEKEKRRLLRDKAVLQSLLKKEE